MLLKFTNNVTKKEYEFTVIDLEDSFMYYHFENLVLETNMDDGEYSYELYDSADKVVAKGLCQVGQYVPEGTKKYNNNEKTVYKQYGEQ